jgi:hypothetical protein
MAATVDAFGGIDILVNNASAIWLRGALDTPMKRFDLMQQVNARGSFLCAQACLPHLLEAPNPHILTLCPPPSLDPKWWAPHTGYTLAKMGMSFVTLGLAAEFGPRGVAVNALWPRTLIATDALNMIPGVQAGNGRSPAIMGDAAHAVLVQPAARTFSGRFLIDDEVLARNRRHRPVRLRRSIRRCRCCPTCSSTESSALAAVVSSSGDVRWRVRREPGRWRAGSSSATCRHVISAARRTGRCCRAGHRVGSCRLPHAMPPP